MSWEDVSLDVLLAHRGVIVEHLAGYGLGNARVVGWAAARMEPVAGVPAEIEVDPPPHTDLTAGDIARIGHELTAIVGTPVLALMGRPQRQQRKGKRRARTKS